MNSRIPRQKATCLSLGCGLLALLTVGAIVLFSALDRENYSCQLCWEIDFRDKEHRQDTPFHVTDDATGPCNTGKNGYQIPLNVAAQRGDVEAIRALLASGVDPNQVSPEGRSPLVELTSVHVSKYETCFNLLIQHGARVDLRSPHNLQWSAMHKAAIAGKTEPIRLLAANGADVNARDQLGRTPLHWAAMDDLQRHGVVTLLLLVELGADCAAKDNDGKTPIDLAAIEERRRALESACHGSKDGR